MKLQLQINQNAINDTSRALVPAGILITPPIDESFWLYRVAVSDTQAIVGFPKFGVIGVGFQKEEADWNTNLPSSCEATKLYDHIKKNKGNPKIPKQRCLDAIRLIQGVVLQMHKQEAIEELKGAFSHEACVDILSRYLRKTGSHEVVEAYDKKKREASWLR